MDLGAATLVGILDRVGIVAFALSGVEVGARRRFDVFGLLVMGVVTATGGGLIRDVILGRRPYVIEREDYLLWAILASLAWIPFVWRGRVAPRPLLLVADAAGLGAFAAAGALAAIRADLSLPDIILMAIVTGVGGGVVRDLLADRVPLVLRSEVNATAAGFGGFVVWAVEPWSNGGAAILGASVAAAIRIGTVAFNLHLPAPAKDDAPDPPTG